jgi:hypothetical protein
VKVDRGSDFAFRRLGLLCVTRSFLLSSRFDVLADYHLLGNDRQGTYTALEEVSEPVPANILPGETLVGRHDP